MSQPPSLLASSIKKEEYKVADNEPPQYEFKSEREEKMQNLTVASDMNKPQSLVRSLGWHSTDESMYTRHLSREQKKALM